MGICYSNTANIDHETKIRFGIISTNLLPSWIWDKLEPLPYSCWNCGCTEFNEDDECEKCGEEYPDEVEYVYGYEKDGYSIHISEYNDLWIMKSPFTALGNHASPCAPGAITFPGSEDYGYALGPEWFDDEVEMPYEVVKI